jgi:hypothetical protein
VRLLVGAAEQPVDLGQIPAAIHHGCMGLPQELIDHIMNMLHDDLQTLKSCSLTCKPMFASSRHLIHQTLSITTRNNQSVLTREEKSRHQRSEPSDIELRFISYMGECGLLQYTRRIYIRVLRAFTPDILSPHLHHFQSLDRVHTLTIEHCDLTAWTNYHRDTFAHFYPTLTSLTLRRPFGHYRLLLQFVLRFPNLESLCLEWLVNGRPDSTPLPTIDQPPPFHGHLRLAGYDTAARWLTEVTNEHPNGINFRSVELEEFYGANAHYVLKACANTLAELTIVPRASGACRPVSPRR